MNLWLLVSRKSQIIYTCSRDLESFRVASRSNTSTARATLIKATPIFRLVLRLWRDCGPKGSLVVRSPVVPRYAYGKSLLTIKTSAGMSTVSSVASSTEESVKIKNSRWMQLAPIPSSLVYCKWKNEFSREHVQKRGSLPGTVLNLISANPNEVKRVL